jgi:hypothetical protein
MFTYTLTHDVDDRLGPKDARVENPRPDHLRNNTDVTEQRDPLSSLFIRCCYASQWEEDNVFQLTDALPRDTSPDHILNLQTEIQELRVKVSENDNCVIS